MKTSAVETSNQIHLKSVIVLIWKINQFNACCNICNRKVNTGAKLVALECDHIDRDGKLNEISNLVWKNKAMKVIVDELDKCRPLHNHCRSQKTSDENRRYSIIIIIIIIMI